MDATMIISQIFLPISLAIIMFGMGLTLVVGDFGRIFTYPKAVLVGLCESASISSFNWIFNYPFV